MENKTDPSLKQIPSPCFQTSLKFPWHQQNWGLRSRRDWECSLENSTLPLVMLLTSHNVLKVWSCIFQSMALSSTYTLSSCIPFVKNHLLKQTYLFVWCSLNLAIFCHPHMPPVCMSHRSGFSNSETHPSLLDPCFVNQPCKDFSRSTVSCIFLYLLLFHALGSDVPSVLLWYYSWIGRRCQQ